MKTPVAIDEAAIIARGYVTVEEWEVYTAANKYTKFDITGSEVKRSEIFFAYTFESCTDKIILANDLRCYPGAVTAGLLGMLKDGKLDMDDCLVRWSAVGPAFMDYLRGYLKEHPKSETAKLMLSEDTTSFIPRF